MKAKLKNPLIFISPTRLCVHNLPVKLSDNALKAICFKASAQGKEAKIVEVCQNTDQWNAPVIYLIALTFDTACVCALRYLAYHTHKQSSFGSGEPD